jgi:hypothetical protein
MALDEGSVKELAAPSQLGSDRVPVTEANRHGIEDMGVALVTTLPWHYLLG